MKFWLDEKRFKVKTVQVDTTAAIGQKPQTLSCNSVSTGSSGTRMRKVVFLTGRDKISDYLNTPVRANRLALLERGYDVSYRYNLHHADLTCDILCLVSKPVMTMVGERDAVFCEHGPTLSFLAKCRSHAEQLIWLDISDSTSVTHFEVLPYVDLYLKKHLLRDRSLYDKPFYGGRIFSDFYHRSFGVTDESPFDQFHPLAPDQAPKLGLSWNMGMGDMFYSFTRYNTLRRRLPWLLPARYDPPFLDPASPRPQDIFLRTTADLGRKSVSFDRKTLISRLEHLLATHPEITGSVSGRLPHAEYSRQMPRTKIAFGPFGWGELNVREYEALIHGCCLVRPDISHMVTWPDIFVAGATYHPYAWDFSDLEKVVLDLLDDAPRRVRLARQGQEAYRDSISKAGMERFCDWFAACMEGRSIPSGD